MKTLRTHGFNQRPRFEQVVGYLERNEPLPPASAAHASASNSRGRLPHFRRGHGRGRAPCAEYQGYGGTRFVEDDLAGDPEAGALASNGQGPPSITDRLRSTADGAQAAADLIGAGAAGLAAAQAFRSQLPQDAAEYVRLNVLPRPGQAQPPPQIIGRPSDVERLLDEAGQRAQDEETAAVAAEEGEVAVAAEGVGGAFGYLGGLAEGAAALAPTAGEVAGTLAAATVGLAVGIAGGAAYGLARGTGWVLENTLFRPQQGSEDAAAQDVRSANGMNDATHRQQHVRQPRKQPRLLSVRLPWPGAVQHAAPLLLGPEPRGSAPVPELAGELQFRAVTPEPASAQL